MKARTKSRWEVWRTVSSPSGSGQSPAVRYILVQLMCFCIIIFNEFLLNAYLFTVWREGRAEFGEELCLSQILKASVVPVMLLMMMMTGGGSAADDDDDDDDDDCTFVIQIAVGSTNVRVGSVIFGARDYHTTATTTVST